MRGRPGERPGKQTSSSSLALPSSWGIVAAKVMMRRWQASRPAPVFFLTGQRHTMCLLRVQVTSPPRASCRGFRFQTKCHLSEAFADRAH